MPNDIVVISEIGPQGPPGTAATVAVGTVAASAPGSTPTITNAGTGTAAVLNFVLPRGDAGPTGPQGTTDYNDLTNKPSVVLTTGAQTVAGVKQFNDTILGNTTPLSNDTGRYPLRFGKSSGWGYYLSATTYGVQADLGELVLFGHNFDRSIPLRPAFYQRWESNYDISHAVGHPQAGSLSELYWEWQAPTGTDGRHLRPMYMTISQPASSCQNPANYGATNYSGKTQIIWWANRWLMGRRFKDNTGDSNTDNQFRYCVDWDMDGDTLGDAIPVLYLQGDHKLDVGGHTCLRSQLILSGRADATIAGDQNNWAPTGATTASQIFVNGGAADRNLTGLAGGVAGRILGLTNNGTTNNIVLVNASASSTAANRFNLPANVTLPPNTSIELRYDGTAAVWRPWGRAMANTGVTPGAYGSSTTSPTFTVDIAGRIITAASVPITLSAAEIIAARALTYSTEIVTDFSFSGTGSAGAGLTVLNNVELQTGTTAGSTARKTAFRRGVSGAAAGVVQVDFSKPIGLAISVNLRSTNANQRNRIWFGSTPTTTGDNIGLGAARGLGWDIRGTRVWGQYHNGSAAAFVDTGYDFPDTSTTPILSIFSNASGGLTFSVNGAATPATGGPTGSTGTNNSLDLCSTNTSAAADVGMVYRNGTLTASA